MATTPTTLFEDLKKALADFKKFLDDNHNTIKTAVVALRSIIPQITDLLTQLIDLLTKIKAEVGKLASTPIPGLEQVTTFTGGVKTLLETAERLLPDQKPIIDDVLQVADVVTGLPSIADIKQEIDTLIDAIITHLTDFKA